MKKTKRFVETANGGFWVTETQRAIEKTPFFCPREECKRITSSHDDQFMRKYGVCSKCYVELVEDRENPLIDVEFYRKRLEERGY
jgi:hypothetical protein